MFLFQEKNKEKEKLFTTKDDLIKKGKWLTYEERKTKRKAIETLNEIYIHLEHKNLSKDLLPPNLLNLFETTFNGNIDYLESKLKALDKEYSDILIAMAPISLSAYHEYMHPKEFPAAHHMEICKQLERLERREIRVLLISSFPGSAKSTYAARSFVQWYMGKHPTEKIMFGAHTFRFANEEFSKVNRDVIASDRYKHVFPDVDLSKKSRSGPQWRTNKNGTYFLRTPTSQTSGMRANVIILDDVLGGMETALSKVTRDKVNNWFSADVLPRGFEERILVLIMTRWHSEDIMGVVERMLLNGELNEPYEIINISAEGGPDNPFADEGHYVWEEFYGKKHFETNKATIIKTKGLGVWNATYLGKPMDMEGGVINHEDLIFYDNIPEEGDIVISVDTAEKAKITSNRTAISVIKQCLVDGLKKHYLLDLVVGRIKMMDTVQEIKRLERKWKPSTILIEDVNAGAQIIENYRGDFLTPVYDMKVQGKGTKEFNVDTYLVPAIKNKLFLLPEKASWLSDVLYELIAFPNGDTDDIVDSISQYLRYRNASVSVRVRDLYISG